MKFGKWVKLCDHIGSKGEKMASYGDIVQIHAAHHRNDVYIVKGDRSDKYFWAKGRDFEFGYDEIE